MQIVRISLLLLTLITITTCQPPDYTLTTTPSSYYIQDVTDYIFAIAIVADGFTTATVVPGSNIIITFPSAYTSSATQNYSCSTIGWPLGSPSLTCSMSYNIMTISGAFPSELDITVSSNYNLKFVINSIKNPDYAQTTDPFVGEVDYNGNKIFKFEPISSAGVTILAGILTVQLSVSPTTADSLATLTVVCQPTHAIPAGGVLKFTVDYYWSTSVYQNRATISQSPICVGINNTLSNLYCSYKFTSTTFTVIVSNILNVASNSSFSFTLYPFSNPPSAQPVGSMSFETYNNGSTKGLMIDNSTNNQIRGITPTPIQNPQLSFSGYQLGSSVQAILTLLITNSIALNDVFYITTPSEIDVSSVQSISMAGTSTSYISILASNQFSFTKITLSSAFTINITMYNISLPNYAASINSPFSIYVLRNNFLVCSTSAWFNITLSPGALNVTLGSSNSQAGVAADYRFSLSFQHAVLPTARISFYFNAEYFAINSNITCVSSASPNCSVIQASNNTIIVGSITISTTSSLSIVLSSITNPSAIGNFTAILITSYFLSQGTYYVQDTNQNSAYFSLSSRPMSLSDMNITASSYTVYALCDYTFSVRNNNQIPINSYIWIVFPNDITLSAITCNSVCISGSYNSSQAVQFQQIGPLSASTISKLTVYHVLNPISTKPTASFQIYIYNSQNQLLQYLSNGPSYIATSPSLLFVSFSSSSVRNSGMGWFNISLTPSYTITEAVAIVMVAPKGLSCATCLTQTLNSSYNQILYFNQVMNTSYQLNLANFTNYYSYQPITVQLAIMSNNLIYNYANGSLTTTNQQPSTPSYLYSFTNHELSTFSDLIITNFTSSTSASNIYSIVVTFGSDFSLSSSICTSNGYSCVIWNNQITYTVPNLGNLSMLTIKNITTPFLSPSTSVTLSTYSSNGYLMDQNSIIVWSIICQLPCKTCQSTNISSCLSCYSNSVLVANQIYYFGPNSTCVSDCGNLYYKNFSTNFCQICSSDCSNCYNYSFCTSCPSNQYLLLSNTTCYSVCPNGYFVQSSQCIACTTSLNCYTCVDQLTCASCLGRFYYQLECLSKCPTGVTTPNITVWICQACPTNCSLCTLSNSSVVVCTSCSYGLLDNGKCVSSCLTANTVPNGLVCSVCDANCLTCQGSTTFCLTCNISSSFPYFLNNKCYSGCPNTYYNDNNSYTCITCTKPCQICYNFSSTSCVSCISSYSLYNNICQSNCPPRFFSNYSQCVSCVSPCLTCDSISICFSCQTNYSLFQSNSTCVSTCPLGYISINQTCVKCSSNCLTCLTLSFCLSCPNSSFLLNGSCLDPCPSAYYSDKVSQKCLSCPYSCSLCLNSSFCTSCISSYILQLNNTCLSLCASNQIPINSICQNCSSNCSSCQLSIYNCTACYSGYVYVPALFQCLSSCPISYYYYPLNQTCLSSCPSAYYVVTNSTSQLSTCISCPQYCTSCLSSSLCQGCESGIYLYASLCYASCPLSAPYPFSSTCRTCNVVDCFSCSGLYCVSCVSGKLLVGSSLCLSSCSSSQIYNSINKTCDTIVNETTSTSAIASVLSQNTNTSLNYIPMPFLIVYFVIAIIVFLMNHQKKLSLVPALFGTIGVVFSLACLTLIIVSFSLQLINSSLRSAGIYLIISGLVLLVITNLTILSLHYKIAQQPKWAIYLIGLLHFSSLALLTANINSYNSYFISEHKPFWKKYKLICKISNITHFIIFLGSVLFIFAISDHFNYCFYAAIQLSILAFGSVLFSWAWILVPIQQPVQQLASEQSSQTIEQLSQNTKKMTPEAPEENSDQKIRKSNIKSQGDSSSHLDEDNVGKTKSNYEFNSILGVVQVNKNEIADALQKGLFRKNKEEILKQIEEIEEFSKIDSAAKLNNYRENQRKSQEKEESVVKIVEQPKDMFQDQFNKEADRIEPQLDKSNELATFDQAIFSKEEEFRHNIIFEEEDEQNLTYYQQKGNDVREISPNIFDMKESLSLGEIQAAQTSKIRIESKERNQNGTKQIITPVLSKKDNQMTSFMVLDVQDQQQNQEKINIFHDSQRSRMKPTTSKNVSKIKEAKEIIYADFEEIISVSDDTHLQLFEEENDRRNDSSRKIKADKPVESIKDEEGNFSRPSDILRQASVYCQPKVQRNRPPVDDNQPTLRSFKKRK